MKNPVSSIIILWIVSFLGYSIHYMLLTNLNIAVTNMVYKSLNTDTNSSAVSLNEEKFHWNEVQQSIVLGAVFWFLWLSHPIGGILSQNFGAKRLIGYSILFGSMINAFLPLAASIHYKLLAVLRMIQGFIVGLSFPGIFIVVPYWIPKHSRGKFLTCFLGISFGSAISYFIGGFIMKSFGWKAVFYTTTAMGLIWCIGWKCLMYDKPELHPRLSNEEKEYIKSKTHATQVSAVTKIPIPWRRILQSIVVYSNIIGQFGVMWTIFVITIYAPRYLSFFHNLSPEQTGVLSSFPHLFRVLISLIFAIVSDYFIKKNILSTTAVRKLATFISHLVTGLAMIGLSYFGNILPLAEFFIFAILGMSGTAASGGVVGFADISPNFGGILQGLCGMCSHTAGFLIPLLVGYLTLNKDTVEQWQKVFLISAAISIGTGLQFICIWDSRVQKWNHYEDKIKEDERTLTELQSPS